MEEAIVDALVECFQPQMILQIMHCVKRRFIALRFIALKGITEGNCTATAKNEPSAIYGCCQRGIE